MRFFYDFEFYAPTMEPISIGVVTEDGDEFYAINGNAPWGLIRKHEWLRDNVLPHLPMRRGRAGVFSIDHEHPDVMHGFTFADMVMHFFTKHNEPIELWGYYAAFDHVLLTQLSGGIGKQPKGFPWLTFDVQQLAELNDLEGFLPSTLDGTYTHHALDDARWTKKAYEALTMRLSQKGQL